jgi:hypothetical protein
MPSETTRFIKAAMTRVHIVPDDEDSARLVPIALPKPFHVAVSAKPSEKSDNSENRLGIAGAYPWASSSRSSASICSYIAIERGLTGCSRREEPKHGMGSDPVLRDQVLGGFVLLRSPTIHRRCDKNLVGIYHLNDKGDTI